MLDHKEVNCVCTSILVHTYPYGCIRMDAHSYTSSPAKGRVPKEEFSI